MEHDIIKRAVDVKNINQILHSEWPSRSYNQIACMRRGRRYKDALELIKIENERVSTGSDSTTESMVEPTWHFDNVAPTLPIRVVSTEAYSLTTYPSHPIIDNAPGVFESTSTIMTDEASSEPLPLNIVQVVNDVLNYDGRRVITDNIDRYFRSLPLLFNHDFNIKLNNFFNYFKHTFNYSLLLDTFSHLIIEYFNVDITYVDDSFYNFNCMKCFDPDGHGDLNNNYVNSRRKQRKLEYADFQFRFRKNRLQAVREIFDGKQNLVKSIVTLFCIFWSDIMVGSEGRDYNFTGLDNLDFSSTDVEFWTPITVEELHNAIPSNDKAAGPDGISAAQILKTPRVALCKLLNLFICAGGLSKFLCDSKTVFIPKENKSNEPNQFRPISMSSSICRLFHKILANRLEHFNDYTNQLGFKKFDGTGASIFLLDYLIKSHRRNIKNFNVGFIDFKKTFDSVNHNYFLTPCIRWVSLSPLLNILKSSIILHELVLSSGFSSEMSSAK